MVVAAALSQHPEAVQATAEIVGQILEKLDQLDGEADEIDLAVLFVSADHRDDLAEIAATVRTLLKPGRLLGVTAGGVVGGAREIEEGPAVALWTASLGGVPEAVRLTAASTAAGAALQGLPHVTEKNQTLLLLADPFSLPVPDVLDVLAASDPPLRAIGGLASGGLTPHGNRLVLDDEVFTDGGVGVLLGTHPVLSLVSQGCRPVGAPMIVTEAQGSDVLALAGQPALTRLEEAAASTTPEERALLAHGVHLGVVVDEHKDSFERGDFLVRNVVGADRSSGSLSVGATVEVGTTVQFQVRDAASAHEDLFDLLDGFTCSGALVFTCNGRGTNLFDTPHHDAGLVAEVTKNASVAGMFCAGEIGPVGPRSFLHGFTACVLLVQ